MLGKTISHYLVLEKLGGGGMGVVYKARDTLLDRQVALKVVSPELLKDRAAVEGFIREAKAASALNHPNILTVHDLVEAEGARFLVMELVEGQTLRQLIGKKGLEIKTLLKTAIQVGEALAIAHKAGIVHRDLKPENIMVRNDHQVKVVDFGLAKLVGRNLVERAGPASMDATVPLEGVVELEGQGSREKTHGAGTLPYMSPEQLSGQPADERSDIFSFGVVLYEMATGQQPFQGVTTGEIVTQIREKEPKALILPDGLDTIVSKCLEKDPADRYQHVDDIVVDLRKIKRLTESRSEIPLPRKTVPYGSPALPRRRSRVVYPSAVTTILLASVVGLVVRQKARRPEVDVVLKWGEELGNASASPDGATVAFDSAATGQREIYVMLAKGGVPLQVTQGPDDKFDPRFSRDGTQLLYSVQGATSEIWTVSTFGKNPQKLLANANSADWSPDGKRVAYTRKVTGEPAALVISDASGYNQRPVYISRFERISQVRWSPDDQGIFFSDAENAMLIAPDGGPARRLEKIPENADDVVWGPQGKYLYYSERVNGITNIWRLKVPDGKPERVTQGPGDDFDPLPLPQSPSLIYAHGRKERGLWVASANGKGARKLVRGSWVSAPAISSDGKRIAYVGEEADGSEYVWAVGRTEETPVKLTREGSYQNLVWSADGARLAYSGLVKGPTDYWHVFVIDSADKQSRQATQGGFDAYVDGWRPDGRGLVYEKVLNAKSVLMSLDLSMEKESRVGDDLEAGKYSSSGRWLLAQGATDKAEQRGLWILPTQGGTGVRLFAQDLSYAKWALHDHAIIYSLAGKTKGKVGLWKLEVQDGKPVGSPLLFFSFPATTYADSEWDASDDLSWVVYPQTESRADFYRTIPSN